MEGGLLAGIAARSEPIPALSAEPMSEYYSDVIEEKQSHYRRLRGAEFKYVFRISQFALRKLRNKSTAQ